MLLQLVPPHAVSLPDYPRAVTPPFRSPGIVLTDNSYFGRRTVYVWGMAAMAIELCIIGILNPWTNRTSVGWAQAIMTLVWTFTFQLSAGQLGKTSHRIEMQQD